jgi:hypothetical protein
MTPDPRECEAVGLRLGDFREGALEEPWRGRVGGHLRECDECAALHEALGEVVALLRVPVPEPGPGFEERVAARAFAPRVAAQAVAAPPAAPWARWREAWRLAPLPLAATLAVALGVAALLALPAERLPDPARRLLERGATAREMFAEHRERLIEDVGALRLVVRGAFSSRVERIQEQLEDYRRLVGGPARRQEPAPARPENDLSFENFGGPAPVAVGAGQVVPPRRPTRA